MMTGRIDPEDRRIQRALVELKGMITRRYPQATFDVGLGEDPEGVYLTAIVDVEDTTEVFGVVVDRLVDMQVEEELPIYVVTERPLERVLERLRSEKDRRPARSGQALPNRP